MWPESLLGWDSGSGLEAWLLPGELMLQTWAGLGARRTEVSDGTQFIRVACLASSVWGESPAPKRPWASEISLSCFLPFPSVAKSQPCLTQHGSSTGPSFWLSNKWRRGLLWCENTKNDWATAFMQLRYFRHWRSVNHYMILVVVVKIDTDHRHSPNGNIFDRSGT